VILLAGIIALGITKAIIRAEITAFKIKINADYFSGSADMGTVEVTRTSSNALYGTLDFIMCLLIFCFVYTGAVAAYKYFQDKEKKDE
jgi:hypothetical protein